MKLFALYIGGDHPQANIELHDMRFAIAERVEDTYDRLRSEWWGRPESLHLDCWFELAQADGHRITLKPEPPVDSKKLYYVNLGGYDPNESTELHRNAFVVAETESKAKVRALKTVKHWQSFHKDDMYEAEQIIGLAQTAAEAKLYIHLEADETAPPPTFICGYKPLGKKS